MKKSVVAMGVWLYDGTVPTTVRIWMLDYDFWYALGEADGTLQPGEVPDLNEDGRLYYVQHLPGEPACDHHFWPATEGFHTLAEAVASAEATVPGPISWQ
ncbi:hypothetical protein ACIP9H_11290 [Streptomyces sp. NPDC088732]|uniref:hypothetical protein n=1 Tax=Streptomyces sp. NPDC088732 TaxID=3365879 RepID=UPI003819D18B